MKQTVHQVSSQSHGNYSADLSIKRGSPRGSLQRFSSSFLNRFIILPFSELMEQEPRHHLVLNCLHSNFAVEQLPIHFLSVSQRNVTKRRVPSLFLSVMFSDKWLNQPHWDEIKLSRWHCFTFFNDFVEIWFFIHYTSSADDKWQKKYLINKCRAPNKRRVRINARSMRPSFK